MVDIDLTGSIGKRRRGRDQCLFASLWILTLKQIIVTIRDRDTMEQIRLPLSDIRAYIEDKIQF